MTRFTVSLCTVVLVAGIPSAAAQAPSAYTPADVSFMSGMIYHHAQALLIAGWAPTHGASPSVRTLCERIIVSQRDEIALLSRWLADRHEAVPHADPAHSTHMMPGMLSVAQLAQLDRARGAEFDELFLRFMIQHHEGAITMVNELFAQGAGEENPVYKIASDVFADQTTEIERMQRMLVDTVFGPPPVRATSNPR